MLGLGLLCAAAHAAPGTSGVAVLRAVAWSPADSVRDGAGEFEVLLRLAQVQRAHRTAGVVSVGDRHGARPAGGERALQLAALTGVPVVKLAPGGSVAPAPHGLFLDGGALEADHARDLLLHCLDRYGPPPAARDPAAPTAAEVSAIRGHLEAFQAVLNTAAAPRVAFSGP